MIHLLVYRLGYCEATVSLTLNYHKAIILLLLHYQCRIPVNKYEFLFHIIFSFLMSSVSKTYDTYFVSYKATVM